MSSDEELQYALVCRGATTKPLTYLVYVKHLSVDVEYF